MSSLLHETPTTSAIFLALLITKHAFQDAPTTKECGVSFALHFTVSRLQRSSLIGSRLAAGDAAAGIGVPRKAFVHVRVPMPSKACATTFTRRHGHIRSDKVSLLSSRRFFCPAISRSNVRHDMKRHIR